MGFLALLPAIGSALGSIFGGAAKGSQEAKTAANNSATDLYRAQSANYGTQQQAILQLLQMLSSMDMERAQFGATSPQQYAQNSLRGDFLANAKPISISHPRANIPQISGGFGPSQFSQNTRQLGQEMSRDALMRMLQGPPKAPDTSGALIAPPTAPTMQGAGTLDKILGYGGLAGSLIGGIGGLFGNKQNSQQNSVNTGGQWFPY